MSMPSDIFCEIPCLTERSRLFSGTALQKKWFKSADKRIIGQYLQKFLEYNASQLAFLGIQPFIIGTDQNTALTFRSSGFIGSVPLRASDTGKQIGDFVVTPRFTTGDRFEEYIEILNLLGGDLSPEVIDSLPLASGRNFRPPLYLEAVKFIAALEELVMQPWRKFDNVEKLLSQPLGQVNWNKYIKQEFKTENRLKFPNRSNVLSEVHSEYAELRYVFDLCKLELLSANTPLRIKHSLRQRITFLEEKLYHHKPKITSKLNNRSSDRPVIKQCKEQANKILNFNSVESTAWRVDFSDVFEKFIQYIFEQAANETGGRLIPNFKIHSRSKNRYAWELAHLEPDAIYKKNDFIISIDAKYKSHLYNKYGLSDQLRESHRLDLHQIMAYCSFSKTDTKFGCLCYPSEQLELKSISFTSNINQTENKILIVGLPVKNNKAREITQLLVKTLADLENEIT